MRQTQGSRRKQAGAHGYVLKSQAARDLIRAIGYLLGEGPFWCASWTSNRREA